MKNIRIALLLIVGVALLASAQRRPSAAMTKLMNAEYFISNMYVDTVNDDKLVEGAIRGMLESLDPHSSYTDAKETHELEAPLQGEFEGIGITFNTKQDTSSRRCLAGPATAWASWLATASSPLTTRSLPGKR